MATCRETVEGALRKLGRLAAGRSARDADAELGLEALKSLYRAWINAGTFGRLRDVVPTSNYVAGENERIFRNSDEVETIELPETVDETVNGPLTPLDLSVVVIVDAVEGQDQTWIYDGAFKTWQRIDDLELTSQAPLSRRDSNGLSSYLATEIAGEFGLDVPPAVGRSAASFQSALTHRFSNPTVSRAGVYY